jgi:hypothetical protein
LRTTRSGYYVRGVRGGREFVGLTRRPADLPFTGPPRYTAAGVGSLRLMEAFLVVVEDVSPEPALLLRHPFVPPQVDIFVLERGIISLHCAQAFFLVSMALVRSAWSTPRAAFAGRDP